MIEAKGIIKTYCTSDNGQTVLKGIDLTIEDGDNIVILGASGSGKSMLMNIFGGLERPTDGKVFYGKNGTDDNQAEQRRNSRNSLQPSAQGGVRNRVVNYDGEF